jgi:hypothetical protein
MALADLVREQGQQIATLTAILDRASKDLVDVELAMKDVVERSHRLESQTPLLEERVADFRKDREDRDRKRWAIVLAVIVSVLTLIVNVVLTIMRR